MAAKRETNLLESWVDPKPPTISVVTSSPPLDLGIDGLIDLELVSVSPVSSVYRAVQPALVRTVAIKVLHDEPGSPSARNFEQESRVTSQLTGHAGIVPLLAAGTTRGGKPYLMMPFYRRGSMSRLMVEHGALNWREASFLVESIAVTVSEVHGRGIVHGNLSASNVLLTDFLLPRVCDFAHSAPIGDDSPSGVAADPATDVTALGIMLWSLILGAPSSRAPEVDPSMVANVSVPPAVLALIDRTMSGDPQRGPASAAAFVTELRMAVSAGPNTGPVPTVGRTTAATGSGSGSSLSDPTAHRNGTSPGSVRAIVADGAVGTAGSLSTDNAGKGSLGSDVGAGAASAGSLAPSAEARYILALVACIAIAVLVMVLAAVLAVS